MKLRSQLRENKCYILAFRMIFFIFVLIKLQTLSVCKKEKKRNFDIRVCSDVRPPANRGLISEFLQFSVRQRTFIGYKSHLPNMIEAKPQQTNMNMIMNGESSCPHRCRYQCHFVIDPPEYKSILRHIHPSKIDKHTEPITSLIY
jgi:hypothetical protein